MKKIKKFVENIFTFEVCIILVLIGLSSIFILPFVISHIYVGSYISSIDNKISWHYEIINAEEEEEIWIPIKAIEDNSASLISSKISFNENLVLKGRIKGKKFLLNLKQENSYFLIQNFFGDIYLKVNKKDIEFK